MSHKEAQKAHERLYSIAPFVPFCGHFLLDKFAAHPGVFPVTNLILPPT